MIKIHLSRILGERRWSQAKLAKITGIRQSTINDIYNEFAERISLDHLDKICEALNCSLADLMTYAKNDHPRTSNALIVEKHGNQKEHKKL